MKRALILLMLAGVASADAAGPRRTPSRPRPIPVVPAPAEPPAPEPTPPSARELANLYIEVGRELRDASRMESVRTSDLWPRFRWINLLDAMKDPRKRLAAQDILDQLRADLLVVTATRSARP